MKYLRKVAVCAVVIIAVTAVYKIIHKHYHHKHHEVTIQDKTHTDGGDAPLSPDIMIQQHSISGNLTRKSSSSKNNDVTVQYHGLVNGGN